MMTKTRLFIFLVLLATSDLLAAGQSFDEGFYRLTTEWQGDGRSLGVVDEAPGNRVRLAASGDVAGQQWKLKPQAGGCFRLSTKKFGEERSLAANGDDVNLAETAAAASQCWNIELVGNGFYRITNKYYGTGKSLDIVNDGAANDRLRLAPSGNYSGQHWRLTFVGPPESKKLHDPPPRTFATATYSGFSVTFRGALLATPEGEQARAYLEAKLAEIVGLIGPARAAQLRNVPIWVEFLHHDDGAMWYHPSKDWLVRNGYPASMEKTVEIKNVGNFLAWREDQPLMVLHELAHAYHNQFIPKLRPKVAEAYRKAVASGKYESVKDVRGNPRKHYALTNETEYFAELSEAYFGRNDFYPFTREELKSFDPDGFAVVREAWTQP